MVEKRYTRFEFTHRGYVYEANRRVVSNTDGWTIIRREEGKANIPPCRYILTNKGWENTCNQKGAPAVFLSEDDVVDYVDWQYAISIGAA